MNEYSPDVGERNTSDGGFSKGWGAHFPPCEEYWYEAHTHLNNEECGDINISEILSAHENMLDEFGVKKSAFIIKVFDEKTGWKPDGSETGKFFPCEQVFGETKFLKNQDRFFWAPWIRYNDPNLTLLNNCINRGAAYIKLHNAEIIIDAANPECWYSEKWRRMFEKMEEKHIPVLWHVTQRLTACPYRGMGANSYWKVGVPKGVTYNNQRLLDIFLDVVEKYPGINFIGAHQLHLGWECLAKLFERYKNLYIDTSVGCYLKNDDDFYANDKEYLRNVFIKNYDRILFATDVYYKQPKMTEWKIKDEYRGHIRFIKRLNLPHRVLQAISHKNAERLFEKL